MLRFESDCMQENLNNEPADVGRKLYIAPGSMLRGEPAIPSSKYYTLRYMLAATLARGEGTGAEGYLPIIIHGGHLHGGRVTISGARSSQYLSSLLFMAPLLGENLD